MRDQQVMRDDRRFRDVEQIPEISSCFMVGDGLSAIRVLGFSDRQYYVACPLEQ
jgi:hypothetical protein